MAWIEKVDISPFIAGLPYYYPSISRFLAKIFIVSYVFTMNKVLSINVVLLLLVVLLDGDGQQHA